MSERMIATVAQGVGEAVVYRVLCKPSAVSVVQVRVFDETAGGDHVTGTVMPGEAAVSAGNIVLPPLKTLVERHEYRVQVRYSDGVSVLEPWFRVVAER